MTSLQVETKHGWFLVSHALAYVTAAKSGVSETELEDLISLDDKVLKKYRMIWSLHTPSPGRGWPGYGQRRSEWSRM